MFKMCSVIMLLFNVNSSKVRKNNNKTIRQTAKPNKMNSNHIALTKTRSFLIVCPKTHLLFNFFKD